MKIPITTILFLPIVFSCSLNGPSKNTKNVTETFNEQKVEKDTVRIDSALKAKMCLAFDLIKNYTQETVIDKKDFVISYIKFFKSLQFGTYRKLDNEQVLISIENNVLNNQLLILFEDTIFSDFSVAHTVKAVGEDVGRIIFTNSYVKAKSLNILASVLLHELCHNAISAMNSERSSYGLPEEYFPDEEAFAYSRQTQFLVFMYADKKEELNFFEGKPYSIIGPKEDESSFKYFLKGAKKYK
ncbi:MAG: hypothetical protein ACR2IQ_02090 [Minisyncoccia bacterium]